MKDIELKRDIPLVEPVNFTEAVKSKFAEIVDGIYPNEIVEQMQRDGYNPIVIGSEHNLFDLLPHFVLFTRIRDTLAKQEIKVGLEITPPTHLQYIRDFLRDEAEFKQTGKIHSRRPSQKSIELLNTYRSFKLLRHHSENLALWLLENGFNVFALDHEDALKWMRRDQQLPAFNDEDWLSDFAGTTEYRPSFTAIKRDIAILGRLNTERPDVISWGLYHAIKFDLLMNRDGQNSIYLAYVNWDRTLQMWTSVHNLYREGKKRTNR